MRNDMSLERVIEFFSCFSKLPVRIEDIREQIEEQLHRAGLRIKIVFSPMDVPTDVLLGLTLEYKDVTGDAAGSRYFVVFYNSNISPAEQRVICCKELVHLYDDGETITRTAEHCSSLVDEVIHESIPDGVGIQGLADKIAIFYALAILFPDEAREDFRDLLDDGKTSYEDMARIFDIPVPYIRYLMSREWLGVRSMLLGR